MISRTILALAALVAGAAGAFGLSAQEADATAILEAAASRYRASSALCADFVQERSVPLLGESRRGRGRLCQKQPNLFTMRFTDPEGDAMVADGQYFWQFTPSSDPRQVLRVSMEQAGGSYDFHREFLESPAERYHARLDGRETVDGSATQRVVLVPRRSAGFGEAVLWIDLRSNLVRRVEVREENGSVTTITLSGIDLNASPASDLFRFTPPPGVEILTP